jgi:hypothetical protein
MEVQHSVIDFEDIDSPNGEPGTLGFYSYGLRIPGTLCDALSPQTAPFQSVDGLGSNGSRRYAVFEGASSIELGAPSVVDSIRVSSLREERGSVEGTLSVRVCGRGIDGAQTGVVEHTLVDTPQGILPSGWESIDVSDIGTVKALEIEVASTGTFEPRAAVDEITLVDHHYTIVLLPDTQKYSESHPDIFAEQTSFVVENVERENIVFVSHLGDIVEHGLSGSNYNAREWENAAGAMSLLDGVVPHGMVPGNHDYDIEFRPSLGSSGFLKHFGPAKHRHCPWWGGNSPNGLNSFQKFRMGNREFIYLHLEVDMPFEAEELTRRVLSENPSTPTLITTHLFLTAEGRIMNAPYLGRRDPEWTGISARGFFERVVMPNDNVFMVTCGHVHTENRLTETNRNGNEVHILLQDYQGRDNGGEGFLRLLRFYPAKNLIHVITYSPWLDTCETDGNSDFLLSLDFSSRFGR